MLSTINPKLIALLLLVVAFAAYVKLSNPNKVYSTQAYWLNAGLAEVEAVPQEVLLPGNQNGSVLMWAAYASPDPQVIEALIARGADVNEADVVFSGTPLSAAAAGNANPAVIDVLVQHGARVDQVVGSNNKTPLIIAAELNANPQVLARLIHHGANPAYRDLTGKTALQQARQMNNQSAVALLEAGDAQQ